MRYLAGLVLLLAASSASAQVDSTGARTIALRGPDSAAYGTVTLGTSRPADVARLLADKGGLGPSRDNRVTFTIGKRRLGPRELYTPPATMNQLYFDHGILVLVVEGVPQGLPATREAFLAAYPAATETHRETGWYELQVPLQDCLWLTAVFRSSDDSLESDGYAWTCPLR